MKIRAKAMPDNTIEQRVARILNYALKESGTITYIECYGRLVSAARDYQLAQEHRFEYTP
jgi:hypothetical protein